MKKFKCLGTTLTNQNFMYAGVKRNFNAEVLNAIWYRIL